MSLLVAVAFVIVVMALIRLVKSERRRRWSQSTDDPWEPRLDRVIDGSSDVEMSKYLGKRWVISGEER